MEYEHKLAWCMAGWMAAVALFIVLHWWQDATGEGAAIVWLCHTMGDEACGPGEPWLKINLGG